MRNRRRLWVYAGVLIALLIFAVVLAFTNDESDRFFPLVILVGPALVVLIDVQRILRPKRAPMLQPALAKGESIEWTEWANHIHRRVPRAGALTLTTQRLAFTPGKEEITMGGAPAEWPRDTIVRVAAEGVDGVDTHGLPGKLIVTFVKTAPQWFQMEDAATASREINQVLTGAPSTPSTASTASTAIEPGTPV